MQSNDSAKDIFVIEANELLAKMEDILLKMEQDEIIPEHINSMFRAIHTLKGASKMFNYTELSDFAHKIEDLFSLLRANKVVINKEKISLLLNSVDCMRVLLEQSIKNCIDKPTLKNKQQLLQALTVDPPKTTQPVKKTPIKKNTEKTCDQTLPDNKLANNKNSAAKTSGVSDSNKSLTEIFIIEGNELLNSMEESLLKIEQHGQDQSTIDNIFRLTHTLKGAAGMFNYIELSDFAEEIKVFFAIIKQTKVVIDPQQINILLKSIDCMRKLLSESLIDNISPSTIKDKKQLILQLTTKDQAKPSQTIKKSSSKPKVVIQQPKQPIKEKSIDPGKFTEQQIDQLQVNLLQKKISNKAPVASNSNINIEPSFNLAKNFIKVDANKLDEIINIIGEVGIVQAHLINLIKDHKIENTELTSSVERVTGLIDSLRALSLQLRMLPIKEIFSKYNRIVRDIANQTNKQIKLQIDGADTELDKSIMEKINEPLLHLVRNACDHGIEFPENRVSLGKPSCGLIKLQAFQENSEVVIKTIDDGVGINIDQIKAKAIKSGLLAEDNNLSKQEILSYIFEPGFSTADKISDLSGRGVGMDVVKREISKLHGSIQIDSKQDQGTTIALRLPLTLSIIKGLLAKISNFPCVIPMWNVIECVEIKAEEYNFITKNQHINFRSNILPCIILSKVLNVYGAKNISTTMIIVQYLEHKVGMIVDNLVGEIQTVIKPMPEFFSELGWVKGATILGNGEVAVILDIPGLISNLMEDRKDLMEVNI